MSEESLKSIDRKPVNTNSTDFFGCRKGQTFD